VTLIDTNVLLDLVTDDPVWAQWSVNQLEAAAIKGPLLINDVVYAELSVRFAFIEALDAVLEEARVALAAMPRPALFLAGKAFRQYRAAGGVRTGVLPDFFIGAHAAVAGLPLLTRDARRLRSYFPKINLIAPLA
jgi:predicted nucleic acid-binding protein